MPATCNSISELVDQFMSSAGDTLNKLQNAVIAVDRDAITSAFSSIKNHGTVKHIASIVQSSESKRTEFVALASKTGAAGEAMLGVYLGVVGALVEANAASLAELLTWGLSIGTSVVIVDVIAVILMVIAVILLLKFGIGWLKDKWGEVQETINTI